MAPKWYELRFLESQASAELRIFGEIGGGDTPAELVRRLDDLGSHVDLGVHIDSVGGSVTEGIHIYNRLLVHDGIVNVTIGRIAAGAASVIAMAGSTVAMLDPGWLAIHHPSRRALDEADALRADVGGDLKDARIAAYARKTRLPHEELRKMMHADMWLAPADALAKGFVDAVIETGLSESRQIAMSGQS